MFVCFCMAILIWVVFLALIVNLDKNGAILPAIASLAVPPLLAAATAAGTDDWTAAAREAILLEFQGFWNDELLEHDLLDISQEYVLIGAARGAKAAHRTCTSTVAKRNGNDRR